MAEVLLNQEQIKEIIPHRAPFLLIDEVLEICDRITVLRDGHFIDTVSSAGSSSEEIIAHMVGKKLKTKRRTCSPV